MVPEAHWCVAACGCLYIERHKHRSHFLSLLLGFLLSQNRPMTPACDLVSSLAKAILCCQLLSHSPPLPRANLCPTQDGGASEVQIGRKRTIISGSGCIVCSKREKKQRESPLAVARNCVIEIGIFSCFAHPTAEKATCPKLLALYALLGWPRVFAFCFISFATFWALFLHNLYLLDP